MTQAVTAKMIFPPITPIALLTRITILIRIVDRGEVIIKEGVGKLITTAILRITLIMRVKIIREKGETRKAISLTKKRAKKMGVEEGTEKRTKLILKHITDL